MHCRRQTAAACTPSKPCPLLESARVQCTRGGTDQQYTQSIAAGEPRRGGRILRLQDSGPPARGSFGARRNRPSSRGDLYGKMTALTQICHTNDSSNPDTGHKASCPSPIHTAVRWRPHWRAGWQRAGLVAGAGAVGQGLSKSRYIGATTLTVPLHYDSDALLDGILRVFGGRLCILVFFC
eukprot:COSAG02_NODE_1590_length_11791_cov_24.350239_1_plen_181_part_00